MFNKIRHVGKARIPMINFQHPLLKNLNIRTGVKEDSISNIENLENRVLKEKISFFNRRTVIEEEEIDIINGYYEVPEFENIKLKK